MNNKRFVKKDSIIYDFSCCAACGTCYGHSPGTAINGDNKCSVVICKACNTPQCMSNGLGKGQCAICYIGLLPGWSGSERTCDYKYCNQPAIARTGGLNKHVCVEHLKRKQEQKYVTDAPRVREKMFVLV